MEEQDSRQFTFTADEKETLEKLDTVEASVNSHIQKNNRQLLATKYYSEFVINTKNGPLTLNNVFITIESDQEGKVSYHFRWIVEKENGEQTIEENMVIDEEGKIFAIEQLGEYLKDLDIQLEELMAENDKEQGRLKGISEKGNAEEIKKAIQNRTKLGKENEENKKDEEKAEDVEQDLEAQGEDLEITSYRKIKDSNVAERMPEVFGQGEEDGIAFSNKLNRFVMITKKDGMYKINDSLETAETAWKSIISIDGNGEKIERKVPHSLMQVKNNDDKEIAVTIGQYGEVDIETVDVLPCDERIARGVRTQGEGKDKEESYEIRYDFENAGLEYKHDLAHQVKEIEEQNRDAGIRDTDITEKDYIPNTQMTWGQLMERTGESLPALVERYNREMTKKGAEPKKVVETIEADYQNISHERNRK